MDISTGRCASAFGRQWSPKYELSLSHGENMGSSSLGSAKNFNERPPTTSAGAESKFHIIWLGIPTG